MNIDKKGKANVNFEYAESSFFAVKGTYKNLVNTPAIIVHDNMGHYDITRRHLSL